MIFTPSSHRISYWCSVKWTHESKLPFVVDLVRSISGFEYIFLNSFPASPSAVCGTFLQHYHQLECVIRTWLSVSVCALMCMHSNECENIIITVMLSSRSYLLFKRMLISRCSSCNTVNEHRNDLSLSCPLVIYEQKAQWHCKGTIFKNPHSNCNTFLLTQFSWTNCMWI